MSSSTIRTVIVTGANSGIGWEAVKALYRSPKPYHIFLGSRSLEKGRAAAADIQSECPSATNTLEVLQVDLDSDESITAAYETVKEKRGVLDCLVNNAGANHDIPHLRSPQTTSLRASFTSAYNTNVAGTHVLTHTLMPLLLRSSDPRLLFITGLANITAAAQSYFPGPPGGPPAGWPKPNPSGFEVIGYRASKCALNMVMLDWNFKLQKDGVKVWAVGPGMLATNLGGVGVEKAREMGAGDASAGGDIIRRVVEGERDGDTGRIVLKDGGFGVW